MTARRPPLAQGRLWDGRRRAHLGGSVRDDSLWDDAVECRFARTHRQRAKRRKDTCCQTAVQHANDYGPRWRLHHVMVRSEADLDDELRAWLQESHDVVGLQADLR